MAKLIGGWPETMHNAAPIFDSHICLPLCYVDKST